MFIFKPPLVALVADLMIDDINVEVDFNFQRT